MLMVRPATLDDAEVIAEILIRHSDGVMEFLLDGLIPGMSSQSLLVAALLQGTGVYAVDNFLLAEEQNHLVGLLFTYPATEHKIPALMESFVPAKRLDPFRPILERSLPQSLYIGCLWAEDDKEEVEMSLLAQAKRIAHTFELASLCLFWWCDDIKGLHRLARYGFEPTEVIEIQGLPAHLQGGTLLAAHVE